MTGISHGADAELNTSATNPGRNAKLPADRSCGR